MRCPGKDKTIRREDGWRLPWFGGEEGCWQQVENTKEVLGDGMPCVGLGWWVHELVHLSKHLELHDTKTEFYFMQIKEIKLRFGGNSEKSSVCYK